MDVFVTGAVATQDPIFFDLNRNNVVHGAGVQRKCAAVQRPATAS